MRKLYENFHILHFQKRIVSTETIRENTVFIFKVLLEKAIPNLTYTFSSLPIFIQAGPSYSKFSVISRQVSQKVLSGSWLFSN